MVVALLLLAAGAVRYYFWQKNKLATPTDPSVIAAVLEELSLADTARQRQDSYPRRQPQYPTHRQGSRYGGNTPVVGKLFPFDPNTITEAELQQLGLRAQVAQAWVRYRERGGYFGKPDDLRKLRMLAPTDADRLIPWVRLPEKAGNDAPPTTAASPNAEGTATNPPPPGTRARIIPMIDLNTADSAALLALPGIGEKRAAALVKYRNRLGGFTSLAQVAEVKAIPDSVLQRISPYLALRPEAIVPLRLNITSEDALALHPYIGRRYAKIIVAYRQQHGPFARVDDLLKIHILNEAWLEPLRPYLSVD
jgi:DNA uptake protein ComE-like DNA-binding protein